MRWELGWSPKWNFDEGLRVTWEWYEQTPGAREGGGAPERSQPHLGVAAGSSVGITCSPVCRPSGRAGGTLPPGPSVPLSLFPGPKSPANAGETGMASAASPGRWRAIGSTSCMSPPRAVRVLDSTGRATPCTSLLGNTLQSQAGREGRIATHEPSGQISVLGVHGGSRHRAPRSGFPDRGLPFGDDERRRFHQRAQSMQRTLSGTASSRAGAIWAPQRSQVP